MQIILAKLGGIEILIINAKIVAAKSKLSIPIYNSFIRHRIWISLKVDLFVI